MTRELSDSFTSTLSGLTMSVVELFSLSSVGMSSFRYTDSNQHISYLGLTYDPYPIKRNKISFSSDLKVDQTTLVFAKNWGIDNAIRRDTLAGADIQIIRVNRDNSAEDYVILFDGNVADTTIDSLEVTARCQTLDFLNVELPAREYQVACNWRLYDDYCTLNQADYSVTSVLDPSTVRNILVGTNITGTSSDGDFADDYWTLGFAQSMDGRNEDVVRQITSHTDDTITVVPPFPFEFEEDAEVKLVLGCAHHVSDCENVFGNLINYGGFPFIPNQDTML
jgi:uncharacterized phage protein (TIGR02218 family)